MIYIKKMFMQVYAALCHAFMPPLYAGTLCQGLYQVYATRAPLGFIPSRSSSCKSLQHKKTSSKSPPYPQVFINPSILSNMFSLFRSEALRVPKAALASRTITSGTPVLMNSARPWPRGGGLLRDVLSHEPSSSRLLYNGLCRGIVLLYAGAMLHS